MNFVGVGENFSNFAALELACLKFVKCQVLIAGSYILACLIEVAHGGLGCVGVIFLNVFNS